MKTIISVSLLCTLIGSAASAQSALDVALAMNPPPCDGNIASAEFAGQNAQGQTVIQVTCEDDDGVGAVFSGPSVAPLLGLAVVGGIVALTKGDTGSSTGTP